VGDGGVLLGDLSRPWQTDFAPFRRATGIIVEREVLLELVPSAESLSARAVPAGPRLVALLMGMLDLATEHGAYLDPLAREALSRHILDVVALVLGARGESAEMARERGLAAARLESIKTYALERLADPGLSVADVAAKHGLGVRYVQRLFELSGTTFTQFVLEQRLQAARRGLIRKDGRARTVSQVALECGFSDVSNFNRAFRRRFGMTPSEMRAEGPRA
jgi:AraC-like DNA-binding protein